MKTLNKIGLSFVILLLALNFSKIQGVNLSNGEKICYDSMHVSVLTCSPHDEVYSLYGHTAIRLQYVLSNLDIVVNYGVFSFHEPHFILRFVFGLTDYEMGIQTFDDFCREYIYYGASVTEQELNLTAEEKKNILLALQKNALPENVKYRYNFLYNNCTTKARDLILSNIRGKIIYQNKINTNLSIRDIIHSCNKNNKWARFGNDMLMGVKADMKTNREEQQFLPANLMKDFRSAIIDRNGKVTPLVIRTFKVIDGRQNKESINEFTILSPKFCFGILLFCVIVLTIFEIRLKKKFWMFDAFITFLMGVAGLILVIMIFSQHPTVSLNLQILMLNPIMFFVTYYIIKNNRHYKKMENMWNILLYVMIATLCCTLVQDFAEGMIFLALSLLIRAIYNKLSYAKMKGNNEK